jgi:hypothetical protein
MASGEAVGGRRTAWRSLAAWPSALSASRRSVPLSSRADSGTPNEASGWKRSVSALRR